MGPKDNSKKLTRIEKVLKRKMSEKDASAHVDRIGSEKLIVYSNRGFVIIDVTGVVNGKGPIVNNVKPVVESHLTVGNELKKNHRMIQIIAAAQLFLGFGLIGFHSLIGDSIVLLISGSGFLIFSIVIFLIQSVYDVR